MITEISYKLQTFSQKEMESTAFHPEAFIIITALCGTLTGKDAGKPMASKLTAGPTSRFLHICLCKALLIAGHTDVTVWVCS